MKFSWRMIAAAFSYALGVLGWCYVGGYKILTGPVRELILAQMAGSMSLGRLVAALIEGFIYLSLAGGVISGKIDKYIERNKKKNGF